LKNSEVSGGMPTLSRSARFALAMILMTGVVLHTGCAREKPGDRASMPIRIGILQSLSGNMAESEKPLADAALLAVEEINRAGGLLGRQVEAVVVDGRSDPKFSAKEAERLITDEKVSAIFGCWTSACRKAVKEVVERRKSLLFYPLQHEGLEQSPNIIYTGSVPNQQAIPAARWAMDKFGKRLYLIGSDYVFPRTANLTIKEFGKLNNVSIVGEVYLPLGTADVKKAVDQIVSLAPDVVINTINGDTNHAFFEELSRRGVKAETTPVLSLSLAEVEISRDPKVFAGHYAAWSYFQSLDTTGNREFVNAFHQRFGKERMIDDPMEASHIGVHLWAQAVKEAGDPDLEKIRNLILRQSLNAPQGIVSVDKGTNHLWRTPRIGRILVNGQFEVVWSSPITIRPTPFPQFHSKPEWLDLLAKELRPQ